MKLPIPPELGEVEHISGIPKIPARVTARGALSPNNSNALCKAIIDNDPTDGIHLRLTPGMLTLKDNQAVMLDHGLRLVSPRGLGTARRTPLTVADLVSSDTLDAESTRNRQLKKERELAIVDPLASPGVDPEHLSGLKTEGTTGRIGRYVLPQLFDFQQRDNATSRAFSMPPPMPGSTPRSSDSASSSSATAAAEAPAAATPSSTSSNKRGLKLKVLFFRVLIIAVDCVCLPVFNAPPLSSFRSRLPRVRRGARGPTLQAFFLPPWPLRRQLQTCRCVAMPPLPFALPLLCVLRQPSRIVVFRFALLSFLLVHYYHMLMLALVADMSSVPRLRA